MQSKLELCELCGEPMPPGESMFQYHGYSGPCPKPPLEAKKSALDEANLKIEKLKQDMNLVVSCAGKDLIAERDQLKSRIAELQPEVKRLRDDLKHSQIVNGKLAVNWATNVEALESEIDRLKTSKAGLVFEHNQLAKLNEIYKTALITISRYEQTESDRMILRHLLFRFQQIATEALKAGESK